MLVSTSLKEKLTLRDSVLRNSYSKLVEKMLFASMNLFIIS